jgi:hypothetical protein
MWRWDRQFIGAPDRGGRRRGDFNSKIPPCIGFFKGHKRFVAVLVKLFIVG